MKVSGLAVIAAIATSGLMAAPVFADRQVEVQRTVVTHTDNGMHHHSHKTCRTHWEHHHKVTHCTWHHY